MRSEALRKTQEKYMRFEQIRKSIVLTKRTDADIIFFLNHRGDEESFNAYIKRLIRSDMEKVAEQ